MSDLSEKNQDPKRSYDCKITCGSCRHTWPIITRIGDNLKAECPKCGRKYELGDVAQTYFWSGGECVLREDDSPQIAATQTTIVPPDGEWYERPSVHFPVRFYQELEGGGAE